MSPTTTTARAVRRAGMTASAPSACRRLRRIRPNRTSAASTAGPYYEASPRCYRRPDAGVACGDGGAAVPARACPGDYVLGLGNQRELRRVQPAVRFGAVFDRQ